MSEDMSGRMILIAIGIVVFPFVAYVGVGLATKFSREAAFDATRMGDRYEDVVGRFGAPSTADGGGKVFARYASERCKPPCEKRLWFENRLFFDIEAWSVSFDINGRVIEKYHWVSP